MANSYCLIMTMCSSAAEARRIADHLLATRMIACANIIPGVESKFLWKGRVEKAREALLVMKTKRASFNRVEARITRLHSYEVPEIIALPISAGSKNYLNWIKNSVK